MTRTLTIASGENGKGRSFSGTVLAYATASGLWEGGGAESLRPIFLQLACNEDEARPLLANLQLGRKATMKGEESPQKGQPVELLRSAGYVYRQQRFPEGVVITAFMHSLLIFDPGLVDDAGVRFVLMPPRARLLAEASRFDGRAIEAHVQRRGYETTDARLLDTLAPMGALFCAALLRRTTKPILNDPRFWAQVYCVCLGAGFASWGISTKYSNPDRGTYGEHGPLGFREVGTADVGLAPGVAFSASHEKLGELLAEQVTLFEKKVGNRG